MSTTRRNNHRAAGGFACRWQIRRDAGFVDVGEDAFTALGDTDDGLKVGLAFRAGRAIRPDENVFAGFNGVGGGEQQTNRETR